MKRKLILLGLLTALGSVAIQMVVPALPLIAIELGTRPSTTQLVVGGYLGSLAVGQLAWAPLIERRGCRSVLIGGMALFIAATLACMVATSIAVLLPARCVQAFGAAGTLVTCRIIASGQPGQAGRAGALATLSSIVLISPAIAPTIGGFLAVHVGWRGIFALLLAVSSLLLILALSAISEPQWQKPTLGGNLRSRYLALITEKRFPRLTGCNAMLSSSLYLFLSTAPFLFARRGLLANQVGVALSAIAFGLISGTLLVPWVERRWPSRLRGAATGVLAAGIISMATVAFAPPSVNAMVLAMGVIGVGIGLTGPALLADTIELGGQQAGLASGLFGSLQMITAALVSSLASRVHPDQLSISLGVAAMVTIAALLRPPALTISRSAPAEPAIPQP